MLCLFFVMTCMRDEQIMNFLWNYILAILLCVSKCNTAPSPTHKVLHMTKACRTTKAHLSFRAVLAPQWWEIGATASRGPFLAAGGWQRQGSTRSWGEGRGQHKLSTVLTIHWSLQPGVPRSQWGWGCREEGETQFGIRLQLDVGTLGQPESSQASTQIMMPWGNQTWVMETTVLARGSSGASRVSNISVVVYSKRSL